MHDTLYYQLCLETFLHYRFHILCYHHFPTICLLDIQCTISILYCLRRTLVDTPFDFFERCMRHLHSEGFTVIALKDLTRFVDPAAAPKAAL